MEYFHNKLWAWPLIKTALNGDLDIDGLMQERRYSIANALELRLSCTNPVFLALTHRY